MSNVTFGDTSQLPQHVSGISMSKVTFGNTSQLRQHV